MSIMRQRIAEHMVLSKRRLAACLFDRRSGPDAHRAISGLRRQSEFAEKHQTKLTFMAFFVRACVDALRDFPTVNASIDGPRWYCMAR